MFFCFPNGVNSKEKKLLPKVFCFFPFFNHLEGYLTVLQSAGAAVLNVFIVRNLNSDHLHFMIETDKMTIAHVYFVVFKFCCKTVFFKILKAGIICATYPNWNV